MLRSVWSKVRARYNIVVAGSGFAGSLMTMIARRLGYSVLLLERGSHPRVVIGESSTPLSNLLLEEIADRYDLPLLRPLSKWGSWQATYPQVGCGLKRGFSFFHHKLDGTGRAEDGRMLVAASPNERIADTHWYRADVDELLVQQAQELGAEYLDRVDVREARSDGGEWTLLGTRGSQEFSLRADFLIDATGPRGLLHRVLGRKEASLPDFPATSALYSHFSGVREFGDIDRELDEAPFPADAAALHHVFEGGWMWVLRFNNGMTSAGFAATEEVAQRFRLGEKDGAWGRLLDALPEVSEQFASSKSELPFTYMPRLAFRSAAVAGTNWALLPSTAGFVDPLLSTGFPLTLLGVTRLGAILERECHSPSLAEYARQTDSELVATAELVGALYRYMGDFPTFRCLLLVYFAAASYAETARRLGKPELAGSFLLRAHPVFGAECRRLLEWARGDLGAEERARLREAVYQLIEDFDVAGLSKRPVDHCYRVEAADLFASAHKLGASARDVEGMLERAGFYSVAR